MLRRPSRLRFSAMLTTYVATIIVCCCHAGELLPTQWGLPVLSLLNESKIQADLKLTTEQLSDVQRLTNEFLKSVGEEIKILRSKKGEDQQRQTIPDVYKHVLRQFSQTAIPLLTADQQQRLRQIIFRVRGIDMMHEQEIVQTLNMSDKQIAEIEVIRKDLIKGMEKLADTATTKEEGKSVRPENVEKLRAESLARAVALLTPQQRSRYEALRGRDFPYKPRELKLVLRAK